LRGEAPDFAIADAKRLRSKNGGLETAYATARAAGRIELAQPEATLAEPRQAMAADGANKIIDVPAFLRSRAN